LNSHSTTSSRFHPRLVQNPGAIEHLGTASRKAVQRYRRQKDTVHYTAVWKWGLCQTLSEVHAFLGTVGVIWIFIKNFSLRAHPLIKSTCKDEPFIFGPEKIKAQEDLKAALLESPALRSIDYTSSAPVILAVDTSYIAVGFHLCQCDVTMPSCCYYNRFCSITLNDRESKYSQLKVEIYGLYRALRALRCHTQIRIWLCNIE
jgi:hypothetical protein